MNTTVSWSNFNVDNTNTFDMNYEYRIILKNINEFDEDCYTIIYMNSCTPYELYFNDAVNQHLYGCININNLNQYEHRMKGQRDQKINGSKYEVYKVQQSTNKYKWHTFHGKYFNIKHDYRLIIDEQDSTLDNKSSQIMVYGYVRQTHELENKGFYDIVSIIKRYYNNSGRQGIINMEQVVKRELYFTPSTNNHWYGCIKSDDNKKWAYRYQGNCVKKVNNTKHKCYKVQCRKEENEYKIMDETAQEFDLNYQYRIRLIKNGGYILVERVTKHALYFGVSISRFWGGCVRTDDLHSWHYVDKSTNKFARIGKGNYSVHCVEFKQ